MKFIKIFLTAFLSLYSFVLFADGEEDLNPPVRENTPRAGKASAYHRDFLYRVSRWTDIPQERWLHVSPAVYQPISSSHSDAYTDFFSDPSNYLLDHPRWSLSDIYSILIVPEDKQSTMPRGLNETSILIDDVHPDGAVTFRQAAYVKRKTGPDSFAYEFYVPEGLDEVEIMEAMERLQLMALEDKLRMGISELLSEVEEAIDEMSPDGCETNNMAPGAMVDLLMALILNEDGSAASLAFRIVESGSAEIIKKLKSYLSHSNPVIRGEAAFVLLSIFERHDQTKIAPFMEDIFNDPSYARDGGETLRGSYIVMETFMNENFFRLGKEAQERILDLLGNKTLDSNFLVRIDALNLLRDASVERVITSVGGGVYGTRFRVEGGNVRAAQMVSEAIDRGLHNPTTDIEDRQYYANMLLSDISMRVGGSRNGANSPTNITNTDRALQTLIQHPELIDFEFGLTDHFTISNIINNLPSELQHHRPALENFLRIKEGEMSPEELQRIREFEENQGAINNLLPGNSLDDLLGQ